MVFGGRAVRQSKLWIESDGLGSAALAVDDFRSIVNPSKTARGLAGGDRDGFDIVDVLIRQGAAAVFQ